MSFIPFSAGASSASSSSEAQSTARSFVDPGQAPFLDFLRNTARESLPGFQAGAESLQGTADQLFAQGQGIAPSFGDNRFLDALGEQAGGNAELVAAQTGQLGSDLGAFFREQLLPEISQGAFQTGGLGGSRQGVAQGVAAGKVADAFSRGSVEFQSADAARAAEAARVGAGEVGARGANQANFELNKIRDLFNLQAGAFGAGFAPLSAFQQLIGGPTVLNESQSTSASESESSSFNFGVG